MESPSLSRALLAQPYFIRISTVLQLGCRRLQDYNLSKRDRKIESTNNSHPYSHPNSHP